MPSAIASPVPAAQPAPTHPHVTRGAARFDLLPHRRAIIDRRVVAEAIAALPDGSPEQLRRQATTLLKAALETGRAEIERRLRDFPSRGLEAAA